MLWPYQVADIEAYAAAVEGVDRPIALSLSPGRDLSAAHLEHLRAHATMWRVCDDVWDRWEDVVPNFARFARWAPHAGPEGWPDGDMLPLGRIGIRAERGEPRDDLLSPAERRSLVTLWVMARSPLMIGGDLPSSDPETISLFTNDEVLRILRESTGNRELLRERGLVVWTAEDERHPVGRDLQHRRRAPRGAVRHAVARARPHTCRGRRRVVGRAGRGRTGARAEQRGAQRRSGQLRRARAPRAARLRPAEGVEMSARVRRTAVSRKALARHPIPCQNVGKRLPTTIFRSDFGVARHDERRTP